MNKLSQKSLSVSHKGSRSNILDQASKNSQTKAEIVKEADKRSEPVNESLVLKEGGTSEIQKVESEFASVNNDSSDTYSNDNSLVQ